MKLKVMTFNVLAPEWLNSLIINSTSKKKVSAVTRRHRQLRTIQQLDPDLLFIQEMTQPIEDQIIKQLGLRLIAKQRTVKGFKPKVAIFAKADLPITAIRRMPCPQSKNYRQIIIQCRINDQPYLLAAVHFEYDNLEVSLRQFEVVKKCIEKYKRDRRVIIAGDFNMESFYMEDAFRSLNVTDPVNGRPTHPIKTESQMSVSKILLSPDLRQIKTIIPQKNTLRETIDTLGSNHFPVLCVIST